jgi:hypothetical protein
LANWISHQPSKLDNVGSSPTSGIINFIKRLLKMDNNDDGGSRRKRHESADGKRRRNDKGKKAAAKIRQLNKAKKQFKKSREN